MLYSLFFIFLVIANLILGFFVYIKDKKNKVNLSFALLCIILAIETLNSYLKIVAPFKESAYFYHYLFTSGVILLPYFIYNFILQITKIKNRREKIILNINKVLTFFFLGINFVFPRLLVLEMTKKTFGFTPMSGPLWKFFWAFFYFFLLYSIYLTTQKYKNTRSPTEKNQMYLILIGFALASLSILAHILSLFEYSYPLAGKIAIFLSLGVVSFAILRKGTISTMVIFEQSFLYLLMSVFLILIYIVVVGSFYLLFIKILPEISIFATILVAIIISHIFQPLKDRFSYYSKKLFFKIDYDASEFLLSFGDKIRNIFDLNKLLITIVGEISNILKCKECFIFLYEEEKEIFKLRASLNKSKEIIFKRDDHIPKYLERKDIILIREDLDIWSKEEHNLSSESLFKIMKDLRDLDIAICIPLFSMERLFGFICLGEKIRSIYTPLDLYVLKSIKTSITPAIKNLMLLEEMRKMKENLYQSDKLATIGTLVSEIAHEIKNPLVSISVFAQLIREKIEDKEFQEKLKNILPSEVEKLNKFLEKLLNFSKTSSKFQKVEVKEILNELLLLLEESFLKNNINLIKRIPGEEVYVLGEKSQLEQVFMNIIMNAIQAMPNGGKIEIEVMKEKDLVKIRISDTGVGISPSDIPKLFDPFFTTKEKGTGLGLSICKRIIKEHRGEIKVESSLNKGTTFVVELPKEE
jgi:signal transduction histidine kinase